ncbi:hypothetical protein ACFPIJ_42190 [Dactylosporangium cerinum]|uniref:Uncharacterized protein n=1 Tax=Dactylosporangium cerinum TaxID=1434730 RepID=A0ABV9W6V8_9ACTN
MDRRLWFDLHATVLHAEHALTRAAHPALILRDGPRPLLDSNGIPMFTATPATRALHTDDLTTTGDAVTDIAVRLGPDRPLRLPLQTRSSLTGTPLRDLLRRGAHDGHRWCTVDLDTAGLRAVTTEPVRDGQPPASAVWRDAHLTAAGLSTYPGQTCPGYRLHGGAPARFATDVLRRIIADTSCSHTTGCPVFTVVEDGVTWLVDEIGDRTPATAADDGWCCVAHPALPWTATAVPDPEPDAVFGYGPDGSSEQCGVCGAVNETSYHELPSMAGYDLDTVLTCTICGSADVTDPIFGARPRPKPWPPQPETQPEPSNGWPDPHGADDRSGPTDGAGR